MGNEEKYCVQTAQHRLNKQNRTTADVTEVEPKTCFRAVPVHVPPSTRRASVIARPTVLAHVDDSEARRLLRLALLHDSNVSDSGEVRFCHYRAELLARAAVHPPAVIIAQVRTVEVEVAAELRALLPLAAIVLWIQQSRSPVSTRLLRCDADAVLGPPESGDPEFVSKQIWAARSGSVVRRSSAVLADIPSIHVRALSDLLLRRAARPVSVDELASAFCGSAETLRRHLVSARLPPPAKLIGWFRIFHAGFLLENARRSVENVALVLGFPGRTSLDNRIRRYAGISAAELRRRGGLQFLLDQFRERHRAQRWELF